jgi:23S rRNA (uridine2552-2'-O)-methyltransferase
MTRNWRRRRRERDSFYELAKRRGIRSRAYFKLENIDKKFNIFKSGDRVIDLGASPGGWLQYILSRVGIDGCVVGVDINPIEPFEGFPNLKFVLGDVFDDETLGNIGEALGGERVDVIVSDLSPNITGIWELDTEKIYDYNVRVLDYADSFLVKGGTLILKSFEGRYLDRVKARLKRFFKYVRVYRPTATRKRSSEIYFVCKGYRPSSISTSNNVFNGESVFIP